MMLLLLLFFFPWRAGRVSSLSVPRTHVCLHNRLQVLESLLPIENHLDVYFGVRAKCITETENVVKIILRSVSKQQLVDAGVAHVGCKLR